MLRIAIEIAGWGAAITMVLAYLLLTTGRIQSVSKSYQWMNILAGAGFIINSGWNGAYPSVALNVVWMGIGLYGVFKHQTPS